MPTRSASRACRAPAAHAAARAAARRRGGARRPGASLQRPGIHPPETMPFADRRGRIGAASRPSSRSSSSSTSRSGRAGAATTGASTCRRLGRRRARRHARASARRAPAATRTVADGILARAGACRAAGYGTEMRTAVLELGFAGLGAERRATSGAIDGQHRARHAVSTKLGYDEAGEANRRAARRSSCVDLDCDRHGANAGGPRRTTRGRDRRARGRACRSSACSLGRVAAPVQRDEELELQIDSLAYGGNGVARLDGFVVFVRAGLPGDTVRARVTKVQRRHAEAVATEVLDAGPAARRGAVRALSRPAAAAASRISPTRRSSRRSTPGSRTRCGGSRASPSRRSSRSSRAEERLRLPQQDGVLVRARRRTGPSSASTAPAAGTRCSRSSAAGSRPTSATRSATRCATGRARSSSPAYDQADGKGYLRHLVVREGAQHRARRSSSSSRTSASASTASG